MKWPAIVVCIAGICTGALTMLLAWMAWTASRLPFDGEGRHFDGMVVHHEQAVLGYSVMAMSFGMLAMACAWIARSFQCHRNEQQTVEK